MLSCYDKVIYNLKKHEFKTEILDIINPSRKQLRIIKRDRANTLFNTKIEFDSGKSNSDKKSELPKFNPLGNIPKHYNKYDDPVLNK
jgi:hypothetical protein